MHSAGRGTLTAMEPARSAPGRFATTAHRALVIVALFFNTLLLALGLAYGDLEIAVGVVYAAPPVVLLMLERFPLAFRLLAAVLGVVYGYFSVVALFAGGVLWVPAALALLTAALLPGLAPGAAARRRRRMIYLGAMAGLVLVIAVTLVLLAL
jgi:hypothetical protein